MFGIASLLTGLVALLHLGFLTLEMFLWRTEIGMKIFGLSPEFAAQTEVLAKNQGFYNGILAAGLIWTFFIGDVDFQRSVRSFFLLAIIGAGIYGAITAKGSILFIQALPALIALVFVRLE